MKKLLLSISMLLLLASATFAQSAKEADAETNVKYQLDRSGNLTFKCVIDSLDLSKDEIYQRIYDYFVYTYGDAQEVIQKADKEAGIIIGKGIYARMMPTIWRCDTWHILRVDIKDGRIRVLVSILKYVIGEGANRKEYAVASYYPFTNRTAGIAKSTWEKIHAQSNKKANATFAAIREAVTTGMTNIEDTNDDW